MAQESTMLPRKLEQADIIYGNAWAITQLDPDQINRKELIEQKRSETHSKVQDDPEIIKKRASDLFYPATNSTMKKIAFSAKKADGFNPSLAICDEIAAWEGDRGLKQYEVMKSGRERDRTAFCSPARLRGMLTTAYSTN